MMVRRTTPHTRIRTAASLIAMAGTLIIAAACGSGTGPNTGKLAVTITAPTGITPSVSVIGPHGYTKSLTATTTLTGLATGSYSLVAGPVTITNPIVGTVYTATVSGSPASVAAFGTAPTITASYSERAGSGGLWVANFHTNPTVVKYSATQLATTTSAAPTTALVTSGGGNVGVAFDRNGNLWVTLATTNAIAEYSASQLASSGTPAPAVRLGATAGSLSDPTGLAFDASGNLWVANTGANTLVGYSASQLASSGSPKPTVTIGAVSGSLHAPIGIAFDAGGDLWVANSLGNTVVEFMPSQLAASGSPQPTVTLSAKANSINGPVMLAFQPTGVLWVTNGDLSQNTVVAFSVIALAATGSPTPLVTLSTHAGSLQNPAGLAFDAGGNLWISNIASSSVIEFAPSQIVSTGSPAPNTTITGTSLINPFGLAFDPHDFRLPIKP
jgi:sugar lactone lactonase YvrE